jgi:predicted RNA-binding Zn-ribbon protein involved in translation (DUF1610 family)
MAIRKKAPPKRSVELLHHFRCYACGKWWSVGDAPLRKTLWFCPWCGMKEIYAAQKK